MKKNPKYQVPSTQKKPAKLREFVAFVDFDVWKYRVRVVLTNDLPASVLKMDPKGAKEAADVAGLCMRSETNTNRCCIVLRHDVSEGTVAHECWHAVRRIMLWAGAEPENEVIAYHLGYLVNNLHRLMRRSKKVFSVSL